MNEKEILFKEESYAIIGACFEVYKEKGCGFHEAIYQECLTIEFGVRGIPFVEQEELPMDYKGRSLKQKFFVDYLCYEKIIVELKAVPELNDHHRGQVHSYLKASNHRLGLLINFGHYPGLEYERIVR